MNAKTLKILVVVTLAVVLAAVAAQRLSGLGGEGEDLPEQLLPGLEERVNDVASIEVSDAERTVALERRESGWVVTSLAGYPAKFETVKQAVVSLADLRPRERKTADPARYGRIGLADPGEGVESVRAVLRDGKGAEIASVVLGDTVEQGRGSQRYVRAGSDPQAWLAEGTVNVPTDPMQWVEREIVRIPRDRITRLTITHPGGEVVSIAREQGGSAYTLENPTEGRVAKGPGEIGGPASALSYLRFDDVRSADEPGFEQAEPVVAVFETGDGLKLTVTTWQAEEKTWAAFDAEAIPQPAAVESAPDGEQADAPPADPTAPEEPAAPADQGEASEVSAATKEASEIDAKVSGWLFALPDYQADSLRKRLEDLTEVPAPPEGESGAEAGEEDAPLLVPTIDAKDEADGGN